MAVHSGNMHVILSQQAHLTSINRCLLSYYNLSRCSFLLQGRGTSCCYYRTGVHACMACGLSACAACSMPACHLLYPWHLKNSFGV